jgi:pyruvate dehydrogenase E1 component alpha subunit
LRDELLGLPTGTSGGRAGSNCIQLHGDGVAMFGHHGLIGENVPLGVGAALGSGRPTLCVLGDGAMEEDYVLAAMGFAVTHRLPVLFVCMDNDLSILTATAARRSWDAARVVEAFGIPVADVADDPWTVRQQVQALAGRLPAFLNVRVCRKYWHVGAGDDGPPEWDRLALVRAELARLGLGADAERIERDAGAAMEVLWAR